jgi:hypothetical protein
MMAQQEHAILCHHAAKLLIAQISRRRLKAVTGGSNASGMGFKLTTELLSLALAKVLPLPGLSR